MSFRQIKSWQWVLIVVALLVLLHWRIRRPEGRARPLNNAIQSQASLQLKAYPYQFHVLRVEGETAVMATPRNFQSPAFLFLKVLYPEINVKDHNNPAFIAVEKTLGQVQDEAKDIVLAQPGIKQIKWELDKEWLVRHHIEVPEK